MVVKLSHRFFLGIVFTLFGSVLYAANRDQVIAELNFVQNTIRSAHPGYALEDSNFLAAYHLGYSGALEFTGKFREGDGVTPYIQKYLTTFQDPHLIYSVEPVSAREDLWVGWALKWNGEDYRVSYVGLNNRTLAPPMGASLVSCDNVNISEFIKRAIAPFVDQRLHLDASHDAAVNALVVKGRNEALPEFVRPSFCKFSYSGLFIDHRLEWVPMSIVDHRGVYGGQDNNFSVKAVKNSLMWMRIPSFVITEESFERFVRGFEKIDRHLPLVLDVRKNSGGNGMVGAKILSKLGLSGQDGSEIARNHAYWRVSTVGIDSLKARLLHMEESGFGISSIADWIRTMQSLLIHAKKDGETWVAQPDFKAVSPVINGGISSRVANKIYVLTDRTCASACLDFVRAVKKHKAVYHVGETTNAGSIFNDVAYVDTPLGNRLSLPLKYWQSTDDLRAPIIPDYQLPFDVQDTRSVITWLILNERGCQSQVF